MNNAYLQEKFDNASERYPQSPAVIAWLPPGDPFAEDGDAVVADRPPGDPFAEIRPSAAHGLTNTVWANDGRGGTWRFWFSDDPDAWATLNQLIEIASPLLADSKKPHLMGPDSGWAWLAAALDDGKKKTWVDDFHVIGHRVARSCREMQEDDEPQRFFMEAKNVFRAAATFLSRTPDETPTEGVPSRVEVKPESPNDHYESAAGNHQEDQQASENGSPRRKNDAPDDAVPQESDGQCIEPADSRSHKPTPAIKPSLDARALGIFIENPTWTKKEMAKQLGCNEKSLAPKRCPKLAAAIAASSAPDPSRNIHGAKDSDGNLEAWEG